MSAAKKLLGLATLIPSYGILQFLVEDKQSILLDSEYIITNPDIKDALFFSCQTLSFGCLATVGTGSLIWMAPGAILTSIFLPTLLYKESKD